MKSVGQNNENELERSEVAGSNDLLIDCIVIPRQNNSMPHFSSSTVVYRSGSVLSSIFSTKLLGENFNCRTLHLPPSDCYTALIQFARIKVEENNKINEFAPLDAVKWFTCFRSIDKINVSTFIDHVTGWRRRTISSRWLTPAIAVELRACASKPTISLTRISSELWQWTTYYYYAQRSPLPTSCLMINFQLVCTKQYARVAVALLPSNRCAASHRCRRRHLSSWWIQCYHQTTVSDRPQHGKTHRFSHSALLTMTPNHARSIRDLMTTRMWMFI